MEKEITNNFAVSALCLAIVKCLALVKKDCLLFFLNTFFPLFFWRVQTAATSSQVKLPIQNTKLKTMVKKKRETSPEINE